MLLFIHALAMLSLLAAPVPKTYNGNLSQDTHVLNARMFGYATAALIANTVKDGLGIIATAASKASRATYQGGKDMLASMREPGSSRVGVDPANAKLTGEGEATTGSAIVAGTANTGKWSTKALVGTGLGTATFAAIVTGVAVGQNKAGSGVTDPISQQDKEAATDPNAGDQTTNVPVDGTATQSPNTPGNIQVDTPSGIHALAAKQSWFLLQDTQQKTAWEALPDSVKDTLWTQHLALVSSNNARLAWYQVQKDHNGVAWANLTPLQKKTAYNQYLARQKPISGVSNSANPVIQTADSGASNSANPVIQTADSGASNSANPVIQTADSGASNSANPVIQTADSGASNAQNPGLQMDHVISDGKNSDQLMTSDERLAAWNSLSADQQDQVRMLASAAPVQMITQTASDPPTANDATEAARLVWYQQQSLRAGWNALSENDKQFYWYRHLRIIAGTAQQ